MIAQAQPDDLFQIKYLPLCCLSVPEDFLHNMDTSFPTFRKLFVSFRWHRKLNIIDRFCYRPEMDLNEIVRRSHYSPAQAKPF